MNERNIRIPSYFFWYTKIPYLIAHIMSSTENFVVEIELDKIDLIANIFYYLFKFFCKSNDQNTHHFYNQKNVF